MASYNGRDGSEEWRGGRGGGHAEVGVGAPGIHQFRADLDVESCWLGRGPLH